MSDASGIEVYHVQLSPSPQFIENAGSISGIHHDNWHSVSYAVVDRSVSTTGTLYWRVRALDCAHNMGTLVGGADAYRWLPTTPAQVVLTSPANSGRYGRAM